MKRLILGILLAFSNSFGFSQEQCDTCFDVNGDVTALTFINDSILAVAGDFDSLVRVESGITAWDIEKDSLIAIEGLYGWIYKVQECDNGLEYWTGSFVYNGHAGNLILVDSNQVLGVRKIDQLWPEGIYARGNRLYYRELNNKFKRTKLNSLDDDEPFNEAGLQYYSHINFHEYKGSLYFYSNIWQEGNEVTATATKFDTATKELSLWFDLERDYTIPNTKFHSVQFIADGLFMLNTYGYKLNGFPIQEEDEFLMIDTNGIIIRTQDSIFQQAGAGYTDKLFRKYLGVHDGYVYFNTTDNSQGNLLTKINKVKLDDTDSTSITLGVFGGHYFRKGKSIFFSENLSINGQPANSFYLIVDEDLNGYSLLPNLNYTRDFYVYESNVSSKAVYPVFYGIKSPLQKVKNFMLFDVSINQVLQDYSIDGEVHCMQHQQGKIYVGGDFSSIEGQPAQNFAVFDVANQSWNTSSLQTDGIVKDMLLANDSIWIAGSFGSVNSSSIQGLACISSNDFSLLKGINMFDSVNVLGITRNEIYAYGRYTTSQGHWQSLIVRLNRTTLDSVPMDTTFFKDVDGRFYGITSFTKSMDNELLGIGGFSSISGYASAGFSIYNSRLIEQAKGGLVGGSCEADYPDPWWYPSTVGSVASIRKAAVFYPGAETSLYLEGEGISQQTSPFILYQDSKVQPLLTLQKRSTNINSCVVEPRATAVSTKYIATGNTVKYEPGFNFGDGVRFLNIHRAPVGRNALAGPIKPVRYCQSEENVTFSFNLIKENNNASIFWELTAGENVVEETDMVISTSDSLQFQLTIPEFLDTGRVILKYGVLDAHYGEISNELQIQVLETPETPLLNIDNGEVFSDQTGFAHAWFTEGGEYIGWNLPYLPLDPSFNQYFAVAIHENGCVSDTSSTITVGIDKNEQPEVVIFPNPATDEVWIKGIKESADVYVYDVSGRLVKSCAIKLNESLAVSMLTPGVYSIQLNSEVFPLVIH